MHSLPSKTLRLFSFVLALAATFSLTSCDVMLEELLATDGYGSSYYCNGRTYSGGRYETGSYYHNGRSYSNRYYCDGRYVYGGRLQSRPQSTYSSRSSYSSSPRSSYSSYSRPGYTPSSSSTRPQYHHASHTSSSWQSRSNDTTPGERSSGRPSWQGSSSSGRSWQHHDSNGEQRQWQRPEQPVRSHDDGSGHRDHSHYRGESRSRDGEGGQQRSPSSFHEHHRHEQRFTPPADAPAGEAADAPRGRHRRD